MRRLIIRPGALGDCLVAFPAMEFLRADYTEIWIPSPIVPLVQFADAAVSLYSTGIERLGLGLPVSEFLRNRLSQFDDIVTWYGSNRPEFQRELQSINGTCSFYPALPPPGTICHITDFLAAQVGAPSGLRPHLELTKPQQRGTVVIHPFSGSTRKNWPLEAFRTLADQLPCPVEWTAGPEEELEGASRFDDLLELAGWIAGARAYIGNDSGVTHLAAATGTPTLALFGPASSHIWFPRGERVQVIKAPDLMTLQPEQVCREFLRLLAAGSAH